MAEGIARSRAAGASEVSFTSAGLYALDGAPAAPNAVEAAGEIGVDVGSHRARSITRAIAERADVIYVMASSHRDALLTMEPALGDKVELLDPEGQDIADPYGSDIEAYRRARDHIVRAVESRMEAWQG
jgi:protein-tyrosine-phosphatase